MKSQETHGARRKQVVIGSLSALAIGTLSFWLLGSEDKITQSGEASTSVRVVNANQTYSTDLSQSASDQTPAPEPLLDIPEPLTGDQIQSGLMAMASPSPGLRVSAVAKTNGGNAFLNVDQHGVFQRLMAQPSQKISFNIQYEDKNSSREVFVGALDGGDLLGASTISPNERGELQFSFLTGANPGSYRINLTTSDHDHKIFDIWVGSPEWELPVALADKTTSSR